jgi:hypothetical protein
MPRCPWFSLSSALYGYTCPSSVDETHFSFMCVVFNLRGSMLFTSFQALLIYFDRSSDSRNLGILRSAVYCAICSSMHTHLMAIALYWTIYRSNRDHPVTPWPREKRDEAWLYFYSLASLRAARTSSAIFVLLLMCTGLSTVHRHLSKQAVGGFLTLSSIHLGGARECGHFP